MCSSDLVRDAVRQRMNPANRESIPDIAWDTGIALQTLYSWRSQWQNQWSAGACDLPGARAVVTGRQAGDSDPDGWVERGRTGKFLPGTWFVSETSCALAAGVRHIGRGPILPEVLDANGPNAPSMSDQRELQRQNQ